MSYKTLAIILVVLLGGMAIYYNQSVSSNTAVDVTPKVETTK
jgi:hypothetical protein